MHCYRTGCFSKVIEVTKQKPFSVTVQGSEQRIPLPDSWPVPGTELVASFKNEFDFDSKGNWIKRTTTTTVSNAKIVHVEEGEITVTRAAMSSRTGRVTSLGMAALLLLASGWSFNIETYNWFAADHHTEYSHAYASRGIFFPSWPLPFSRRPYR
jgi:hypothetical protein